MSRDRFDFQSFVKRTSTDEKKDPVTGNVDNVCTVQSVPSLPARLVVGLCSSNTADSSDVPSPSTIQTGLRWENHQHTLGLLPQKSVMSGFLRRDRPGEGGNPLEGGAWANRKRLFACPPGCNCSLISKGTFHLAPLSCLSFLSVLTIRKLKIPASV